MMSISRPGEHSSFNQRRPRTAENSSHHTHQKQRDSNETMPNVPSIIGKTDSYRQSTIGTEFVNHTKMTESDLAMYSEHTIIT